MDQIIKLVTQPTADTCMVAAMSSITQLDVNDLIAKFHDRYVNGYEPTWKFFDEIGLFATRHYVGDNVADLKADRVYLLVVPSLNIKGGLHFVVAETTMYEGSLRWYITDPNEGREDRIVYEGEWLNSMQWIIELSWDIADIIKFRDTV